MPIHTWFIGPAARIGLSPSPGPHGPLALTPRNQAGRPAMHRRLALKATLLAAGAPLAGCGQILDDLASACIDFDGPEFRTEGLPDATVGLAYAAMVEVAITREPYDDSFAYHFHVVGTLPPGLHTSQTGQQRWLLISGTPTQAGGYGFRIEVTVDDPVDPAGATRALCWTATDKDYRLAVAAAPG